MGSCEQWIEVEYHLKVMEFSRILLELIRSQCNCYARFNQSFFKCFEHSDVSFRVSMITSYMEATEVIGIIKNWTLSQMSVTILNETFLIEKDCPLQISIIDGPSCQSSERFMPNLIPKSKYILIGTMSAVLVSALLIVITIITFLIAYKTSKRYICSSAS